MEKIAPGYRISRRNFIRLSLLTGVSGVGGVGYAQADNLEVLSYALNIPSHLPTLKIAVLADFHAGVVLSETYFAQVIAQTNAHQPDIVCLLGDYVDGIISRDSKNLNKAQFIFPLLGKLKAKQGVYAVLGNHDHWAGATQIVSQLEGQGIRVLNNAAERLGENFVVAGVDDYWEGPALLEKVLRGISKEDYVVLLSHNPDINLQMGTQDPVNLVLSGHTHGGQIRIPFTKSAPWVPCDPRYKSATGLINETETRTTFLSKGVGTFLVPVRINCPPDIGILTLTPSQNHPTGSHAKREA